MEIINVSEILNKIYKIAENTEDEHIKLQAFSMILFEQKNLNYQDIMYKALEETINSLKKRKE